MNTLVNYTKYFAYLKIKSLFFYVALLGYFNIIVTRLLLLKWRKNYTCGDHRTATADPTFHLLVSITLQQRSAYHHACALSLHGGLNLAAFRCFTNVLRNSHNIL